MGKIVAAELLEMIDSGKTGVQCAAHFGVSSAAISKTMAKLRPQGLPPSMQNLTDKQRAYVAKRTEGKSKTDAAQEVYNCDRTSARTLGCRLDKDPDISVAIVDLLHQEGAGKRRRIQRLVDVIESPNLSEAARGIELAAKMCNEMSAEKVDINWSAEELRRLIQLMVPDSPEIEIEAAEVV